MMLVDQEMLERTQKEGAKATPLRADLAQISSPQERSKKVLSKILALSGIVALFAGEDIEGIPIGFAELLESFPGSLGFALACSQHQAPVGRVESSSTTLTRFAKEG